MKITNYQKIKSLNPDSLFLVDGATGTKTILAPDLARELLAQLDTREKFESFKFYELPGCSYPTLDANYAFPIQKEGGAEPIAKTGLYSMYWAMSDYTTNVQTKRSIYRGQNLGDHVTDEQWEEIRTGRFRNMFLGDYWRINGIDWMIVDYNYLRQRKQNYTNHLVLMPRDCLYRHKWNETNTTAGGYLNSTLYKSGLQTAKNMIQSAFGVNHLKMIDKNYSNATDSSGNVTGIILKSDILVIPGELELYGARLISNGSHRNTVGGIYVEPYISQFSLFRLFPRVLRDVSYSYWLSDIADSMSPKIVSTASATYTTAGNTDPGVRPYFVIEDEN